MDWSHKESFWHGTARFAGQDDLAEAGMLRQTPSALFLGFFDGTPIWYDGEGGLLMVAGARSGKLRDVLAYNVCSGVSGGATMLVLDVKGELAAIGRDQTPDGKHCHYWNPLGVHDLPQSRVNPVGYAAGISLASMGFLGAIFIAFGPLYSGLSRGRKGLAGKGEGL